MNPSDDLELSQRLGLYQVFLKLYERHRGLLDEILELENTGSKALTGASPFIQGMVQSQQSHLVTNLLGGKTQALMQSEQIWTIGRDATQVGLAIPDKRLSRCHAAIRYAADQGFHLIDLQSSNGSYVNGERIRQPHLLKDGDRLRLGSMTISFFVCSKAQDLGKLSRTMQDWIDRVDQPDSLPKPLRKSLEILASVSDERLDDSAVYPPDKTLLLPRTNLWDKPAPSAEQ